jgi:hypothetical protein
MPTTEKQSGNEILSDKEVETAVRTLQDPLYFIENAIGVNLWDKQKEIVESVWKYKITLVKASFNVGKTYCAAAIGLAFLFPNVNSRVLTTAPTNKQVEDLLWGEITNMVKNSKRPLIDSAGTPEAKLNQTDLILDGKKWFATGITVQVGKEEQSAVRFSGYHGPMILDIIDEASGVHKAIWKAVNGHMSGENSRLLAITNPRTNLCEFKELWDEAENNPRINRITISAFDHPNIKEGREVIPGGVGIEWVEDMIRKHCEIVKEHSQEDHTFEWKGKIYKPDNTAIWELCGEFPKISDELFFGMLNKEVHDADKREIPEVIKVLGSIDYGNWMVFHYGSMDNKRRKYITDEFVINDPKMELLDRAKAFKNFCFSRGYKNFTVVCDVDMFAEPAKAYGGGKKVVDIFSQICNSTTKLDDGREVEGLNITFVRAIKQKKEDATYRIWCNRQMKSELNWQKDNNGLWLREPTLFISVSKCYWFWETVPKLVHSLIMEEDFDEKIGIDHCFIAGTKIFTLNGEKGIEKVKKGEYVLTRRGFKRVLNAGLTDRAIDTYEMLMYFSGGEIIKITSTSNHGVYEAANNEFVPISKLRRGDILLVVNRKEYYKCLLNISMGNLKQLNFRELFTEDTLIRPSGPTENTTGVHQPITKKAKDTSTEIFGNFIMVKFHSAIKSIIKTTIHLIMLLRILSVWTYGGTKSIIKKIFLKIPDNGGGNILKSYRKCQRSGIGQRRDVLGTENMQKNRNLVKEKQSGSFVQIVVKNMKRDLINMAGRIVFVLSVAGISFIQRLGQIKNPKSVKFVAKNLKQDIMRERVLTNVEVNYAGKQKVYNMEVEDDHEYYANGILVHNCIDASKQLVTSFTIPYPKQDKALIRQIIDEQFQRGL